MKRNQTSLIPLIYLFVLILAGTGNSNAQNVDFSKVYVPEESTLELVKITKNSDFVCLPSVKRSSKGINWLTNRILSISPDGNSIAYLSLRDGTTNIFTMNPQHRGSSVKRTNRSSVIDFSYSPDGASICFAESKGRYNQLFVTDASKGYVCKQITSDALDYSPVYDKEMNNIFFTRLENDETSIWSYDLNDKSLSTYTSGMNPFPSNNLKTLYVARPNGKGNGEIWRVNLLNGEEECIISDAKKSFFSPMLSPDGKTILLVGASKISTEEFDYWNTDIYTCSTDGSELTQITFHAADDLSPVWSPDGNYIYFISQRGESNGSPNIWRLTFNR